MARLVFAMNQSLDGNVHHEAFGPTPAMFQHFIDEVGGLSGSIYGRVMYDVMRYWDEDQADWEQPEWDYAAVWRAQPKWVVSRTLETVGPNATLVTGDLGAAVRAIKDAHDGEIEVAGPMLASALTELGLVDEYRIYLHPVVAGAGPGYFAGSRPGLRLVGHDHIVDGVLKLTYVPA